MLQTEKVKISVIANNQYVSFLIEKGCETHVFQNSNRRVVVIKFPYQEDIYEVYESTLGKNRIFCLTSMTQREIEVLSKEFDD
jgi:uncharacterized protein (DUF1330 family)